MPGRPCYEVIPLGNLAEEFTVVWELKIWNGGWVRSHYKWLLRELVLPARGSRKSARFLPPALAWTARRLSVMMYRKRRSIRSCISCCLANCSTASQCSGVEVALSSAQHQPCHSNDVSTLPWQYVAHYPADGLKPSGCAPRCAVLLLCDARSTATGPTRGSLQAGRLAGGAFAKYERRKWLLRHSISSKHTHCAKQCRWHKLRIRLESYYDQHLTQCATQQICHCNSHPPPQCQQTLQLYLHVAGPSTKTCVSPSCHS